MEVRRSRGQATGDGSGRRMQDGTFIKRNPVLSYFALTFAISWGGVMVLGAPYGMPAPSSQAAKLWPMVFMPYFIGPCLAGLLLTGLVHGMAGLREVASRLRKWRVGARWYMVALLTAPLLVIMALLTLMQISPGFLPGIITSNNRVGLLIAGLVVGLVFGGLMEELGWTGFAVPALRRRQSVLASGLIVGFLWGTWHILPTFWASGNSSGALDPLLFLPPCIFYVGVLPVYRVLMVWVHDRTRSLLVTMLMHASLTASSLFILAPSATGVALMGYYAVLTAALCFVFAAVVVANGGQLSTRPLAKTGCGAAHHPGRLPVQTDKTEESNPGIAATDEVNA